MARRSPLPLERLPAPHPQAGARPGPRMRRWRASAALEVGLPLAEERADPFLRVIRLERGREPFCLGLQAFAEVTVCGHPLDLLDRDRCLAGQLARPRQ